LRHLARIHRRQFDELGKNVEARRADVDVLGLDSFFNERLLQRLENDLFARGLLRAFRPSGLMAKVLSRKPPASLISNSASLRLPAPKSTARNDFVFNIAVTSRAARKTPGLFRL
jgi:hypothetical protein